MNSNKVVTAFEQIDWSNWQETEKATLLFLTRGDRVLLIRKKRGLGAGKINGPGGRLDPGETLAECAIREVFEELEVTVTGPIEERGELLFQFTDGYALHVYVFMGSSFEGEATETEEAVPIWAHKEQLPFEEMWADDRHWLPKMLAGKRFHGKFLFDGDQMEGHVLEFFDS